MENNLPDIGLQTNGEVSFLHGNAILCILAEGSYSHIVLRDKRRITLSRKLGELEFTLPDYFLRIHHSHIVNLHHVVKYVKDGTGYVVLSNGEELKVSKLRRKALMERYRIL